MAEASRIRVDHEQGATFVELFFDLVFVFAVTQLTATVLHDLSWPGVGRALLLFWLVWWSWTQFTWTLNTADTEHVWVRLPVLAATAVAFFLAQAVPDAYGSAGLWFAGSYVLVRLIGLALQEWVYQGDDLQASTLSVWTRASAVGLLLVIAGGVAEGSVRVGLWAAALAADIVAAALAGRGEWRIAHGHFAERHGLIIIIALGESLIAAGVATKGLDRGLDLALTVSGAVVSTCALWWSYFGLLHDAFEQALSRRGDDQGSFARDVFSLMHAAIVAGVIGVAVGFEAAVAHPSDPLHLDAALALSLGLVLFVGGTAAAAARSRVSGILGPRLAFLALVLLAAPLIPLVPAGVALWVLAGALIALGVVEARRSSRVRVQAPEAA